MITKMNYLLLSTMMVAAIDSTFCRCCDCCKKLCEDKGSSGPSINPENNKTTVDEKLIQKNVNTIHNDIIDNIIYNNNFTDNIGNNNNFYNTNENNDSFPENLENNDNSNHKKIMHDEKFNSKKVNENENEETLYFLKIDKTNQDDNIKKCFNNTWYNKCQNKVLLLQRVNESGSNVLSVTGSDNDWKITDQGKKVLGEAGCKPEDNKWIIVKVITLNVDLKSAETSFIFYVDDINNANESGVFDNIECYSIEIIAANTRAMESMWGMFFRVRSALEQDGKEDTGPGLIGLDKLNVENVTDINWMFYSAIHKQATLDQLKKWCFSGGNKVSISCLFNATVPGLNFSILNDWSSSTKNGTVFFRAKNFLCGSVFVESNNKTDFNPPIWYDNIEETK